MIRSFAGVEDVTHWLRLRKESFAELLPHSPEWREGDFEREFTRRSDWRPEWIWFATWRNVTGIFHHDAIAYPVGAISMRLRARTEAAPDRIAVANWLAVAPTWRRRGIARALLTQAETAAWNEGVRQIEVETHRNWQAAMAFYQRCGYR